MRYVATALALSTLATLGSPSIGQVTYTIQSIGTLGGNASTAYGLNEAGDVVGSARDPQGVERPVLYTSDGVLEALPDLGFGGIAYGVNATREATGAVSTGQSYTRPWDSNTSSIDNVALWSSGVLTNLGNLGGLPRGEGRVITDDGWVVGTASAPLPSVPGEDIWQRAFIKTGAEGSIRDAGTFPGDIRSFIFDLNDARQAPGFSVSDNRGGPNETRAGVWQFDGAGNVVSIAPLDPIAPGRTSVALGINNAGTIVGRSATESNQQVTVLWPAGQTQPTLLPVLETNPGGFVRAWEINDAGLVVGELRSTTNERFATLWQDLGNGYERLDLQNLVTNIDGWDLQGAFDINNAGQIVGYGLLNGQQRGFILTPIPEPASLSLLAGAGLLALRRRRSRTSAAAKFNAVGVGLVVVCASLTVGAAQASAGWAYSPLDADGRAIRYLLDRNAHGEMVGSTPSNPAGSLDGFVLQESGLASFWSTPNALAYPTAINDAGVVVGVNIPLPQGLPEGFQRDATGVETPYGFPGALGTIPFGITNDGLVSGFYITPTGRRGFVAQESSVLSRSVEYPGAAETQLFAASGNGIVGGTFYNAAGEAFPFLYDVAADSFELIAAPAPGNFVVTSVNNSGDAIVFGLRSAAEGYADLRSFYRDGSSGAMTELFFPGALETYGYDIGNDGVIVGYYQNVDGSFGGFSAVVPEPTTLSLLAGAGVMALRRRK